MLKTEQQIERDFYALVKDSELGRAVKGGIYRSGTRPSNSTSEDLVIKFLSGLDGQIQTGIIIINLYVPDKQYADVSSIDFERVGELQELIMSFVGGAARTEYAMQTDGTPRTILNEEIGQHLIYARIKFKRLS